VATPGQTGAGPRSWRLLIIVLIAVLLLVGIGLWALQAGGSDDPARPTASVSVGPGNGGPTTTIGTPVTGGTLNIEVAVAPPNQRTAIINGTGFGPNEEVVLRVDNRERARVRTDGAGAFVARVPLSPDRDSFAVRADGGTSGRSATGTITF
jgi:hypothetical protein